MTKENRLLILWIIFGFVFVLAIESVLYFLLHLIYFALAEIGLSYTLMTYVLPILTLLFYSLTAFLLVQKIKTKSKSSGIYLTEFPRDLLIASGITVLILTPLTNKLSGIYAEKTTDYTILDMGEYLTFYGWFNLSFAISQTIVLIAMVTFALKRLKNN